MTVPRIACVLLAPALLLLAGLLVAQDGGSPDGLPDITGSWTGKLKYKGYVQFDRKPRVTRGSAPFVMTVSQEGSDLSIEMTLRPDSDPELWVLTGVHGNGHFLVKGMFREGKGPMMILGHVKKKGTRIKGTGAVGLGEDVAAVEIKVIARRPK